MRKSRHLSATWGMLLCFAADGVASSSASVGVTGVGRDISVVPAGHLVKISSGRRSAAALARSGWLIVPEAAEEGLQAKAVFKVNLRHCNIDQLEATALAVSELDSPRYGKHLSSEEVCRLTKCPDREHGTREVLAWLTGVRQRNDFREQGPWDENDLSIKVYCSHIAVTMSRRAARATFPEADLRAHLRSRGGNRDVVLRATGDVLIPEAVAEHVEFISGLTELWTSGGQAGPGKGLNMGKRSAAASSMEAGNFTEVFLTPRTLRTLYGVPDGERGGWAGKGNNRQGVAAFDDFYLASDLCSAHNLLAPDSDWLVPPDVTYIGPSFDPAADEAESDLDTQYIAMMGTGVPVTFSNHAHGQWVLDWAQEAADGELTPDKGGPLVWSVSYGFPELWQCFVAEGACEETVHGYDPTIYLKRTNAELAKLAAMGVSVLIASGDDGSPGLGATCPVDPKMPIDITGGVLDGWWHTCPFADREDCRCASFIMETPRNESSETDTPLRCIIPLGLVVSGMGVDTPGADCEQLLGDTDCEKLLLRMENDRDADDSFLYPTFTDTSACQVAFSPYNLSFYSNCTCTDVPTVTEGNCSLSGYTFDSARDGSTAFTPDFPASSPWVTSVGATQIAWDLSGSCLQADLLGPGNSGTAETAVNKYTGGFDGGGGFSTLFPAPDYQTDHVKDYVASDAAPPNGTFNPANRGYPDVSAAGHNYVVVVGGRVWTIGGTSASAPALAGMISLMNERLLAAGKPPLGFLNPALYKAAVESPESFQAIVPKTYDLSGTPLEDIVGKSYQVGSNRCTRFSCCQIGYGGAENGGWDPVTGLGTINYEALADYLKIPAGHQRPPDRRHDRHHAAYIAWIVVLVFGLATSVIVLVYESRPKLILSASNLGRSARRSTSGFGSYLGDAEGRRWDGGGVEGGGDRRRRPRGALTEMVMESDIALGLEDSAALSYRLLENDMLDGEADGEADGEGGDEQQSPGRRRV